MADTTNWLGTALDFGSKVLPTLANAGVETYAQNQTYNREQAQRNQQKKLQFGMPDPESQALAAQERENRLFPGTNIEVKKFDTMTPEQKWASNASLYGSIPGGVQKALPGLLPAIRKYGGTPGKFVSDLFGPDTSRIDEAAQQQQRHFDERIVPQITAQFGRGQEVLRDRAIADARTDLDRHLVEMKAGAYERGLARNDQNSHQLFEAGMKPQFQYGYGAREGEVPRNPVKEATELVDPKTGNKVEDIKEALKSTEKTNPKLHKQFSALEKDATYPQKLEMAKAWNKKKGELPLMFSSKKATPEDFQKYNKLVEIAEKDPQIKKLLPHATSNLVEANQLYSALSDTNDPKNRKILQKMMLKYGVLRRKGGNSDKVDWELIGGIAKPILAFAAAPIVSVLGPVALAKAAAGSAVAATAASTLDEKGAARMAAQGLGSYLNLKKTKGN